MTKLINFPLSSHRLFANQTLNQQLTSLIHHQQVPESLKTIINQADAKLNLILKTMLAKVGPAGFLNKYGQRLAEELTAILNHPESYLLDYFLVYEDIAHFFESQDIIANIGRGPAAGSLVNFYLGITKLDPLAYNLIFERWLTPDKAPDIDLDGPNREELHSYLQKKYGKAYQRVQVQTFWKLKSALKEVFTDLDKYAFVQNFIEIVNELEVIRKLPSQAQFLKTETQLWLFMLNNYPAVNLYFEANPHLKTKIESLLDQPKDLITHASAVILSDYQPPLLSELEHQGIVKIDILGMQAYTEINQKYHLRDFTKLTINHAGLQKVINQPASQDLLSGARNYYFKIARTPPPINSLIDLAILLAKGRTPINFIHGQLVCPVLHPQVNKILQETQGELIFQEQIIQIIHEVWELPLVTSAQIMLQLSKNSPQYQQWKQSQEHNETQQELLAFLEKLAPYCFNKAHALSYCLVEYLRHN